MIRFVDIGSDEKPKKSGPAVEAKAVPASEVAPGNPKSAGPKPAKRAKASASASKAANR